MTDKPTPFYVTIKVTPDPAADEDQTDAAEGIIEAAQKNWPWTGGDIELVGISEDPSHA